MSEGRLTRTTRQRQVVLETLKEMHTHPDASVVYEVVRKKLPRISLGTVYRNLDTLVRSGLVGKVEAVGARMHFDGNTEAHCHVQCVRCGAIVDAEINGIDAVAQSVSEATEFEILDERVGFLGICPRCAGRATEKKPGRTRAAHARGAR